MWIIFINNPKELQAYLEARSVMTWSPCWYGGIKHSWASSDLGIHVDPDRLLKDVRV